MRAMRIAMAGLIITTLLMSTVRLGHADEANKLGLVTSGSMGDALRRLGEGREVELVLTNGKSYRGKLGSIGNDTVILSQIAGKEFYDVLIALDEVAAVELRARGN